MLALIAAAATAAVALAIQDIYGKLDQATIRLCVVEQKQQEALAALAQEVGVYMPPPLLPRECRAKPGAGS